MGGGRGMKHEARGKNNFQLLASCFLFITCFLLCLLPSVSTDTKGTYSVDGYENNLTKEISGEQFLESILQTINEKRSEKGLLPLSGDLIANKVASEQSFDLIMLGYLSYYNSKDECPDERYTLVGGIGATTEIIKGFEFEKERLENEQKIKLTRELANQLVESLTLDSDDSSVLFNTYVNNLGCGFSLSQDRKKFVGVLEFVTKALEMEPLSSTINFGEKINLVGKVQSPYKFKAVSVAYFDKQERSESNELIPYFPPQDYIAFSDNAKTNFMKIIKGIGFIGAIGASPFTGGATSLLAPVILSSIQNSPPREVPLKGGIKVRKKGDKDEFSGSIELNYQGMSGLYFISVLGELPGVNFPIVISRRTVRVNQVQISKGG